MTNATCGRIILSIDLDGPADPSAIADTQQHASGARHLLDLLNRHRFAATWGVTNPSRSTLAQKILVGPVEHEIAVLGDTSWVGSSAGRARFACELSRRVESSRAAGVRIETLMLRDAQLTDDFDLLAKHGLSVVRPPAKVTSVSPRNAQPKLLRFGVWQAAAHVRIPGKSGWIPGFGGWWAVRRGIRQGISSSAVVHVAVDGAALASDASSVLGQVERMMNLVQQQRDWGVLQVETLRGMTERLGGVRKKVRSRSILRKVA